MYAKLENGILIPAPKRIPVGENIVYNPTDGILLEFGYLPVRYVEQPESPDGYYYESGWEEQPDAIVQTWTLTPLPDDIDDSEALEILLGGGAV